MKYQYGEVYRADGEMCFYDGTEEVVIANTKEYIQALNILGNYGWKVVQIVNKLVASGFSGYNSVDRIIVEKQI